MDERLIIAVSGFPEIYDTSLFIYRDTKKKNETWKRVAEIVGIPVEECKKRWKSLRDVFRRERKKEKGKSKSGAEASTSRPWRYSQVMGFLIPFMEERATSSNMPQEETSQAASQDQGGEAGQATATTSQATPEDRDEGGENLQPVPPEGGTSVGTQSTAPDPEPPGLTPAPTPRERPRGQKRAHDASMSPFERHLIGAVDRAVAQPSAQPTAQPSDPDEMFFRGLLPDLKALSSRKKAEVKFKIHQMIYEATCQEAEESLMG